MGQSGRHRRQPKSNKLRTWWSSPVHHFSPRGVQCWGAGFSLFPAPRALQEAAMGSYQVFTPLDLEVSDRVDEAAWAQVEARQFFRDHEKDSERQDALRKFIMDLTGTSRVDFDTLYERVVTTLPEPWTLFG